jgi:formate dehydrogenase assembly factor FdhD
MHFGNKRIMPVMQDDQQQQVEPNQSMVVEHLVQRKLEQFHEINRKMAGKSGCGYSFTSSFRQQFKIPPHVPFCSSTGRNENTKQVVDRVDLNISTREC